MHYVKCKDKRTGITYVYESESYWDKEKQQPRAHRRLIGKLDEETGEIVPTDGRGRKRRDRPQSQDPVPEQAPGEEPAAFADTTPGDQEQLLKQKEDLIMQLRLENARLRKEKSDLLQELSEMIGRYTQQ